MRIDPVLLNPIEKVQWLQNICMKYGDFKLAYNYKKIDGSVGWSKHKTVMECWYDDLYFLKKATHRQILPYEIILDLDDEDVIKKVFRICDYLDFKREEYYCFTTGGKGYHIHIISKDLARLNDTYKRKIREFFFSKFKNIDFDNIKISSNVLISMEFEKHRKTGNCKQLLRCYRDGRIN